MSAAGHVRRLEALHSWGIRDAAPTPFGHGENKVFRAELPTAGGPGDGVLLGAVDL